MVISAVGREWKKNKKLSLYGFDNLVCASINKNNKNMGEINMAEKKWHKIEDTIKKFEQPGDEVTGTLVAIEENQSYGGKVYKLENGDKTITVFGTAVLDSRMAGVEIGSEVLIRFVDEKPNKTKGYNPIKNFDVFVSK